MSAERVLTLAILLMTGRDDELSPGVDVDPGCWHAEPMKMNLREIAVTSLLALGSLLADLTAADSSKATPPRIDASGVVQVPAFALPLSSYMSDRAQRTFVEDPPFASLAALGTPGLTLQQRRDIVSAWYRPRVERALASYPVNVREQMIAGVRTDVVTPKEGVPHRNRNRVLIALHGSGYAYATADGLAGLAEAIPIAGTAHMKVIAVDYRMSPEHKFPAATLDVIAVYKELLKTYQPASIGIYGGSTGATLTGTVIARIQAEKLPSPGAAGLFCGGATKDDDMQGDSVYTGAAALNLRIPAHDRPRRDSPYMEGTSADDPLVAPVASLEVLASFPPTLLISGTRDVAMSDTIYTHARLVKAGVDADLHVWDGMWHAFLLDVELPESKDAHAVVARFFQARLKD